MVIMVVVINVKVVVMDYSNYEGGHQEEVLTMLMVSRGGSIVEVIMVGYVVIFCEGDCYENMALMEEIIAVGEIRNVFGTIVP